MLIQVTTVTITTTATRPNSRRARNFTIVSPSRPGNLTAARAGPEARPDRTVRRFPRGDLAAQRSFRRIVTFAVRTPVALRPVITSRTRAGVRRRSALRANARSRAGRRTSSRRPRRRLRGAGSLRVFAPTLRWARALRRQPALQRTRSGTTGASRREAERWTVSAGAAGAGAAGAGVAVATGPALAKRAVSVTSLAGVSWRLTVKMPSLHPVNRHSAAPAVCWESVPTETREPAITVRRTSAPSTPSRTTVVPAVSLVTRTCAARGSSSTDV